MGTIPHPWGVRLLTELNNQSKMVAVSKKNAIDKKKESSRYSKSQSTNPIVVDLLF